jgi:hypothetical protein
MSKNEVEIYKLLASLQEELEPLDKRFVSLCDNIYTLTAERNKLINPTSKLRDIIRALEDYLGKEEP